MCVVRVVGPRTQKSAAGGCAAAATTHRIVIICTSSTCSVENYRKMGQSNFGPTGPLCAGLLLLLLGSFSQSLTQGKLVIRNTRKAINIVLLRSPCLCP